MRTTAVLGSYRILSCVGRNIPEAVDRLFLSAKLKISKFVDRIHEFFIGKICRFTKPSLKKNGKKGEALF